MNKNGVGILPTPFLYDLWIKTVFVIILKIVYKMINRGDIMMMYIVIRGILE